MDLASIPLALEHTGETNLRNLANIGQIERIEPNAEMFSRYFVSAKRLLRDSSQSNVSIETRCIAAYTAAHQLCLAALYMRGFAPGRKLGHRAIVFQTLAPAVGADHTVMQPLGNYHRKRNRAEYNGWNEFDEADLTDLTRLCACVWSLTRKWLELYEPRFLEEAEKRANLAKG